jgi:hypothetical protein
MTKLYAFQASGTHQVTLHTPPKGDLFAAFHSDRPLATPGPSSSAMLSTPMIGTPGGMFNPYAFIPPWLMPGGGVLPYPATPTPAMPQLQPPSVHVNAAPSSDPSDETGANPYPEIMAFFTKLDKEHPRRNLMQCANDFERMDFYHINEIITISVERLCSAEFGLTAGNAQFIIETLKAEVKRIDRTRRKSRISQ